MHAHRFSPAVPAVVMILLGACGDDAQIPTAVDPFPDDFLWGTAIAPYQVEGGLTGTDWYQWETRCEHCSGDSAENGPDFWNKYELDLDNAASISNNAIRLGIDWSRVFPTEESFPNSPDPEAVQRYHEILAAARDRDLEPMVTLVHFALPIWIQDLDDLDNRRGWEDPAIVDKFTQFAAWAGSEYGAQVDLWITINEPFVNLTGGWISGDVPPGKSFEIDLALDAGKNMVYAHAGAYDALHEADEVDADGDGETARVSISKHNRVFLPKDPDNSDQVRATRMLRYLLNDYFLEAVVFGNIDENFDYDSMIQKTRRTMRSSRTASTSSVSTTTASR